MQKKTGYSVEREQNYQTDRIKQAKQKSLHRDKSNTLGISTIKGLADYVKDCIIYFNISGEPFQLA